MATHWLKYNPLNEWQKGDVGYLIMTSPDRRGGDYYTLSTAPARTNMSHEPMLEGWCGSYNNVSTYACGVARVVRATEAGCVQVWKEDDSEKILAILDKLGWEDEE